MPMAGRLTSTVRAGGISEDEPHEFDRGENATMVMEVMPLAVVCWGITSTRIGEKDGVAREFRLTVKRP